MKVTLTIDDATKNVKKFLQIENTVAYIFLFVLRGYEIKQTKNIKVATKRKTRNICNKMTISLLSLTFDI